MLLQARADLGLVTLTWLLGFASGLSMASASSGSGCRPSS